MKTWRRLCWVVGLGLVAGWGWLPAARATDCSGGTVTTSGDYKIHTFTSSGTLTVNTSGNVDVLVVGGGGAGGGGNNGGGGGGGGFRSVTDFAVSGSISVTVGAGGVGSSSAGTAASGGDSIFSTITAKGGGGGGGGSGGNGGNGGSSGGGAYNGSKGTSTPSPVQGNDGANGLGASAPYTGGGGGGAGTAASGGQGGSGSSSSISGAAVVYGGGGSGGQNSTVITGGSGGGGNGGANSPSNIAPTAGTNGRGGGGGGCQSANITGASGGSGIVIVRYLLPGTITINVTPDTGSWTITSYPAGYAGPTSGSGDLTTTTAPVGSYTVHYGALSGYSAPADETLSVAANVNTAFSGTYAAAAYGTLSIDVTPNTGSWTITSHPPEYTTPLSGTGDLSATAAIAGSYTVHYEALAGYAAPADQTLSVVASANTAFSGTYTALTYGSLSIDVTPNSGSWTITSYPAGYTTPLSGSGDLSATAAPVGSYTVHYGALAGYDAPVDQTLSVADGVTTAFSGYYTDEHFQGTGGTVTTNGGYRIHTFTSSGTLAFNKAGTVDVLVLGGGGAGGGGNNGGGGGAGGYRYVTDFAVSGSITVTVGAGGLGASSAGTAASGGDSIFSTITATGGGGGGGGNSGGSGGNGGSSGGGAFSSGPAGTRTPSPVQGNNGAAGSGNVAPYVGGGGGGAGTAASGGQGGNGQSCSISGASVVYGGGGSAGQNGAVITGGTGGGGDGGASSPSNIAPTAGAANRGGGGGGCQSFNTTGGSGGSGIVIVRYLLPGTITIDVTPNSGSWTISSYPADYSGPLSGTGDLGTMTAPVGSYTVHYNVLAGYAAPADQTLSVTAQSNTAFSGTYTAAAYGTLSIDVTPNSGSWTITSHPSEYTTPLSGTGDLPATNAIAGSYTVHYEALAGYLAPADQTLSVVASANTAFSGTYTALTYGTLSIEVTPNSGTWTITSYPAGYTAPLSGSGDLSTTAAPVGSYTVHYGTLTGFDTPADQTLSVADGVNTAFAGVYTEQPFTATGGSTVDSGGYRIHTFTSGGTLTFNKAGSVDVLVVGGGGGGGGYVGGGGGAGGVVYQTNFAVGASPYTVTVGTGGAGGANLDQPTGTGTAGNPSSFSSLTAGGGGGGGRAYNHNNATTAAGSGGGAGTGNGGVCSGQSGTAGQGYAGGNSYSTLNYGAGGGGGAGGVGTNGTATKGGDGGPGVAYSISGTSVTYGGGGGGAGYYVTAGSGGAGGGGDAGNPGVAGTNGRGGGGGGGGVSSGTAVGGTGGSGIVIVRYALEGTLTIDVTPNTASWTITSYPATYAGPLSGTGDLAATIAAAGSYTVHYGVLAGYSAPADQTLAVTALANTAFSGTYAVATYGTLSVDVTPNTASWTITAHPPEYTTPLSGTGDLAATNAIVGSYTVHYEAHAGYLAPADQTLSVVQSANTAFTGTYTVLAYGTLSIDVTPNSGSWTITAYPAGYTTPLSGSGDLAATAAPVGSYTVHYGSLGGYSTPADQTLSVVASANTAFSGAYVEQPFTATGGTITEVGNYRIHTFTGGGTLSFNKAGLVDVLVVGGGGGGGGYVGGGGGAGGVLYQTDFAVGTSPYTVTVGTGGAGGVSINGPTGTGTAGNPSTFSSITAGGGGGGGRAYNNNNATVAAGSGGGAGCAEFAGVRLGQLGTAGQGNDGGNSDITHNEGAGGGGGADGDGGNGDASKGGDGGPGVANAISGSSVTYGGGGGGAGYYATAGSGGAGGGGAAGNPGVAGTNGRGGGGGGGGVNLSTAAGGAGGDGVVIVRYLLSGTLSIDVTPNAGSWTITSHPTAYTGPTSGTGDLAASAAVAGSYTVEYNALTGYTAPAAQTLSVAPNANTAFSGAYVGATLSIDVTPDTGSWTLTAYPGGYTGSLSGTGDLAPVAAPGGTYTVHYGSLSGFAAPADQTQVAVPGAGTTFSATYRWAGTQFQFQ